MIPRPLFMLPAAAALAAAACLSSTEPGPSPASSDGGPASGTGTDAAATGNDAAFAPSDPCGTLMNCCAILRSVPFMGNNPTAQSGCLATALPEEALQCNAGISELLPHGTCGDGSFPIGDAGPAACGPRCTQLAGCCSKLTAADAGNLIPGCTALSTNCTTGSESYCNQFINIVTGVIISGGAPPRITCP